MVTDIVSKPIEVEKTQQKVTPFDLARLRYPDLVLTLLDWVPLGYDLPGFAEKFDLSQADLYAFLIKTFKTKGKGIPAYMESNPVIANAYEGSFEKHLLDVKNMLYENRSKFKTSVIPIATLKNYVLLVDEDLNLYKGSFDADYSNFNSELIGKIDNSPVKESLDGISKSLLQENKFDVLKFNNLLQAGGSVRDLKEQRIVNFLENIDKGFFSKFYKLHESIMRKEIRNVSSKYSMDKVKDARKGLQSIVKILEDVNKDLDLILDKKFNAPVEYNLEDAVIVSNLKTFAEAFKDQINCALNIVESCIDTDRRLIEDLYNSLYKEMEKYLISHKFLKKVLGVVNE